MGIAERVERRLQALVETEQARWAISTPTSVPRMAALGRLLSSGGKRLRPAFCYWGFVGAGGDVRRRALDRRRRRVRAAPRLRAAPRRRHGRLGDTAGLQTTHVELRRRAPARGLVRRTSAIRRGSGDPRRRSGLRLRRRPPSRRSEPAWRIWNELRIELNVGQYLDILGTARGERRRATAERIARYKSGKYTVERPLHLGAVLAAPDRADELLPALSAYGLPLGDAFQLRDDVLGAFGEVGLTGKPVGDDLREGKPTSLMAVAADRAGAAHRKVLTLVGRPDLTEGQVEAIQSVLVETGALAEMEIAIDALTRTRWPPSTPPTSPTTPARRSTELAHYVAWRGPVTDPVRGHGRMRGHGEGRRVGAGLGGLSAAAHLLERGHDVQRRRAGGEPGGRAGVVAERRVPAGHRPDGAHHAGPAGRAFAAAGADMSDFVTIRPVDPMYRGGLRGRHRAAGLARAGADARRDRRARRPGRRGRPSTASASGLHALRSWRCPTSSTPTTTRCSIWPAPLGPAWRCCGWAGSGGSGTVVASYFSDERLRRIFSFQSMYAGLAPYQALALYAVITYMDTVEGVFAPEGGMHQMADRPGRRGREGRSGAALRHSGDAHPA